MQALNSGAYPRMPSACEGADIWDKETANQFSGGVLGSRLRERMVPSARVVERMVPGVMAEAERTA